MSREIKFRGWDTFLRIWLNPSINRITFDGSSILDANNWSWNVPGRVIVEQFTGLKDKNGNDSYLAKRFYYFFGILFKRLIHRSLKKGKKGDTIHIFLVVFYGLILLKNMVMSPFFMVMSPFFPHP